MSAAEIAAKLKPAQRKGLLSRPGSGNMTRATLTQLYDMGLMDWLDFYPTDLGYEVRKALGARDQ